MAYTANSRFRNGLTMSFPLPQQTQLPRPSPSQQTHIITTTTTSTNAINNIPIKQSKYILRHIHEAIVKKYQQSIYKLGDDFERELQLKDEIIANLQDEIARLRYLTANWNRNNVRQCTPPIIEIIEDDESASDDHLIEETYDSSESDSDESPQSSHQTKQEMDYDESNEEDDETILLTDAERMIDSDYDDDYDDEEVADETTAFSEKIVDEHPPPTLVSIKIQPNEENGTEGEAEDEEEAEETEETEGTEEVEDEEEEIHKCEQCNKVVSNRRTLMKHIRIVHAKYKKHICEYCTRSFPQKDGLRRHLRIHTGEKPFTCEGCHRSFNQSGNRRIHEKSCKKIIL